MFSTVLTQVTGLFESSKDFLRIYFFPVLLWIGGIAALALGSQSQVDARLDQFQKIDAVLQIAWLAFSLAGVAVLASVLASARIGLLRLYEGYWPRWLAWLGARRAAAYRRYLLDELENKRTKTFEVMVYREYPDPRMALGHEMPTRLGNILKAAELYPRHRYGADTVVIWPRLYRVIPEELRKQMTAAKASVDFGVTISMLAWSFAAVGGAILFAQERAFWLYLTVLLGGAAIGWLAYQSAVASAIPYGDLIRAAFDLHRVQLLIDLGYLKDGGPNPNQPLESRQLWLRLSEFQFKGVEAWERRNWPPHEERETKEPERTILDGAVEIKLMREL